MAKKLNIKQIRSAIGRYENQKLTIRALGIRKMGKTVTHNDSPAIRGMIDKVRHLVKVTEAQGE
jgi:large subunit ribosomal protein L30